MPNLKRSPQLNPNTRAQHFLLPVPGTVLHVMESIDHRACHCWPEGGLLRRLARRVGMAVRTFSKESNIAHYIFLQLVISNSKFY
jgi:hypothetical protein